MSSEIDPPATRDMSRAHIQRTAEVVVSRETVEPFYEERRNYIQRLTADEIFMTGSAHRLPATHWVAAQRVSVILLRCPVIMPEAGIEKINDIMSPVTYSDTVPYSIGEGIESQAYFPLHLAYDISTAARRQRVNGFETDTFGGIINIIKRADFRAMVDTAAFTANAVWRSYSTSFHNKFQRSDNGPKLGFVFDEAGRVDFTPEFKKHLHKKLADVNETGKSEGGDGAQESTSSGCPARRLRPSFTNSEHDQRNIEALAATSIFHPKQ